MIPLVAPTITRTDRNHILYAANHGLLTDETYVRQFEEAFAQRVNAAGAVAVNSGTSALTLAWKALNLDTVTAPSYACAAIPNSMPINRYVDSTFNVKTQRMTQQPADILVHAFGRRTLTNTDPPIEDYTLSLGGVAVLRGQLGVCSTSASKMISTGRGGLVFSNDRALLEHVRELAYYDDVPSGRLGAHSLGMTSMQAALGLSQLQQLDDFIERRRKIASDYSYIFRGHDMDCPASDCGSVFFRYLIAVDNPADKIAQLAARGVEAGRGVYPPLHHYAGLPDDQFPGATQSVNRLLSVPCHPSLTDKEVAHITEQVVQVCAP